MELSLGDTRDNIAALARTVESELGTALSDAITGLIDGTTTVQEAFSNMFANIGKAFIDMATQMLAQKAILMLLKALGGAATGGGASLIGQAAIPGFADGGRPTPGKLSIVGEEGPELFLPDTSGTVIPNDAFAAARGAMGGSRGGSTSEDGGLNSDSVIRSFSENSNSITMTNSYMRERSMERESMAVMGGGGSMVIEAQVINNVEYASVEQVQAASAAAAKQARAQVFSDMKNKPSRRAMVGLK